MNILRSRFMLLLIAVFFLHGVLYYLMPSMHYSEGEGGWLNYLKYPIAAFVFALWGGCGRFNARGFVIAGLLLISALFALVVGVGYESNERLNLFVTIVFPIFSVLMVGSGWGDAFLESKKLRVVVFWVLVANFIFCLYEILSGGIFVAYSATGSRAVGMFVNPNNTGIFVAILSVYLLLDGVVGYRKFLVLALAVLTLVMTGSKTGVLIFLVGMLFMGAGLFLIVIISSLIFLVVAEIFGFSLLGLISALDLREIDNASGQIRLYEWSVFYNNLFQLPVSELMFGFVNLYYIDNSYFDMVALMGFVFAAVFLVVQIISLFLSWRGSKLVFVLLLMMFISMLATNTYRLWPNAYLYWFLIGVSFLRLKAQ